MRKFILNRVQENLSSEKRQGILQHLLTLLADPPGRGGSGRHGQRLLALAIVQEAGEAGDLPAGEAGEAGDPGQVGGDGRAPLTSPHQDSHTGPGQPGGHSSASSEFLLSM